MKLFSCFVTAPFFAIIPKTPSEINLERKNSLKLSSLKRTMTLPSSLVSNQINANFQLVHPTQQPPEIFRIVAK